MPLILEQRVQDGNFYLRGAHRGVHIRRTTGTNDRDSAEKILAKVEAEINARAGAPHEPLIGFIRRAKRPRPDRTYLYCIQSLDYVKVGLADDPDKRLVRLAAGNPHEMKGIETWELKKSVAFVFEAAVHRLLDEYAVGREWFKTTPDVVRVAVEQHNSIFDPPTEFSKGSRP